jgi:hypothetical protein
VRNLRVAATPEARVIIETPAGEECQVDYGTGPMVRDPDSGKYRRTRQFVLTLDWSRKCVRLLAFRSSARVWAELDEKAFRRLGGSPRIAVLDNLREGVLSPDFYDPGLNPLYRDVLVHYGVTALPCKVRDPDRKGKVESGVAHAQKAATGAISKPPEAVTAISGTWDGELTRQEKSALGTNTVYWVWFDEPQYDADGDGPYRGGSIWGSALTII